VKTGTDISKSHKKEIEISFDIELFLLKDYKVELSKYYMSYINDDDGDREHVKMVIDERIEKLVNITNNAAAEKVAKIKVAFVKAIGEELAKHYYIQGGNGEVKRVILDRGLVG
jgi:hypothetical protein